MDCKLYLCAALLACAVGWSPTLASQQPQRVVVVDPIRSAQSLIDRGDIAAAVTILDAISRLSDDASASLDPIAIKFLTGQIAFHQGQVEDAVGIYRQILADRPNMTRARLELGRALFAQRQDRQARHQFERALAGDDLPNTAIDNVERFLFQIEDRKLVRTRFALSLVPDSNINQATNGETVDIFGLPFVLNEEAQEESGLGVFGSAGIEYRPQLGERTRLLATLNVQRTEFDGKAFDDSLVSASLGAERRGTGGELRVEATAFRRWFGTPGFNRGAGARFAYNKQTSGRSYLQLALAAQYVDYDQDPSRDGLVLTAQAAPVWMINPATQISGVFGLSREIARVQFQRSTGLRLGLGLDKDLPWGLTVLARPEINWRRFGAIQPAFGKRREDVILDFSFNLIKRDKRIFGLVPSISYSLTHNASSIGFFKFTRHRFNFGLNRRF